MSYDSMQSSRCSLPCSGVLQWLPKEGFDILHVNNPHDCCWARRMNPVGAAPVYSEASRVQQQ